MSNDVLHLKRRWLATRRFSNNNPAIADSRNDIIVDYKNLIISLLVFAILAPVPALATAEESEHGPLRLTILQVDNTGGLYVSPVSPDELKPHQERFQALYDASDETVAQGTFDRNFKRIPLEALDFLTQGKFGSYVILDFGRESVNAVKARVKGAVMAEWYCAGVIPLLELELEGPRPDWLYVGDEFPDQIAVEFARNVASPTASNVSTDERWYTRGRLLWPDRDIQHDFAHTSAYTSIEATLTDIQSGEELVATRAAWDCH